MVRSTSFGLCLCLVILGGCKQEPRDPEELATEIVSTRTVGLAYLEENRLEEAETEFLKLIDLAPEEAIGYANLGLVYLRMGRYDEAEERLDEALSISPEDSDIRLLLATVYEMVNRNDEAMATLRLALSNTPDHVKILYTIAELVGNTGADDAVEQRGQFLARLAELVPGNIAARMQLAEVLVRNGQADMAVAEMEEIRRQLGEMPREAVDFYQQAIGFLRSEDTESALTPTVIVHNFLRGIPRYRAGAIDLEGPGGAAIGSPVITFHQNIAVTPPDQEAILAALHFTDATETSGISEIVGATNGSANDSEVNTYIAVADFDGDKDRDVFVQRSNSESNQFRYLLVNDFGSFEDAFSETGIPQAPGRAASWGDYDNDGKLDLFVAGEESNSLFHSQGGVRFEDISRSAGIQGDGNGYFGLFVDLDHEGDLDVFVGRAGANQVFRNNLDGSFAEVGERMDLVGEGEGSTEAAIGDFDDDGDIDLFVVNGNGADKLYSNLRQGAFEDVASNVGLSPGVQTSGVAVGDYDNDGFLDLFVVSDLGGEHRLYQNTGEGSFSLDTRSSDLASLLGSISASDAQFFDFDNDGYQDLLVVGRAENPTDRGLFLFRNDGTGQFEDFSAALPEHILQGVSAEIDDYNEDGDLDVFLVAIDGSVKLLRNDGGNANRYVNVGLVGLTTGSGKNNHFGIGAKLEVRAGDLYQTRVVTSGNNHIGLGPRLKADVIRIVWTNGVPQNIFFAGSDQDLVEQQILKGSCGLLHVWDGEKFTFTKDIVWRSALGMPLGIMGGRSTFGSPHASQEYMRIPPGLLQEKDGVYPIKITEELWETLYLDEVMLVAVDHPDSVEVYVDERFEPTQATRTPLRLFKVGQRFAPVSAVDDRGNDLLGDLLDKDDIYASDMIPTRFQGVTELHDLVMDLGPNARTDSLLLFLEGGIFPTDASINQAMGQSESFESISPYLQVRDAAGRWVTAIDNISFPMGKDKAVIVDLSGIFPTEDRRIRIRTNMEIYWDRVFYTLGTVAAPAVVRGLPPISGDLQYRGFSRTYRKGGRYGPHWFDYNEVSLEPKWRDLVGYYTRYGDVLELLTDPDEMYVIMNAGDEVSIEFAAQSLPDIAEGWERTFLIYSYGWLKDGDLNTAAGQTVEPLPFRGMSQYPYGADEHYPIDRVHQDYLRRYNTRRVVPNIRLVSENQER